MWTNSSVLASGQIVSDVVADVRVPIMGDKSARRSGSRRNGSLEFGAVIRPAWISKGLNPWLLTRSRCPAAYEQGKCRG